MNKREYKIINYKIEIGMINSFSSYMGSVLNNSKTSNLIATPFIVCVKCFRFSFFKLNFDYPDNIIIQCDYFGFNQNYSIKDYLQSIQNIQKPKDQMDCIQHNKPFLYYCKECKKHYCERCIKQDENHTACLALNNIY